MSVEFNRVLKETALSKKGEGKFKREMAKKIASLASVIPIIFAPPVTAGYYAYKSWQESGKIAITKEMVESANTYQELGDRVKLLAENGNLSEAEQITQLDEYKQGKEASELKKRDEEADKTTGYLIFAGSSYALYYLLRLPYLRRKIKRDISDISFLKEERQSSKSNLRRDFCLFDRGLVMQCKFSEEQRQAIDKSSMLPPVGYEIPNPKFGEDFLKKGFHHLAEIGTYNFTGNRRYRFYEGSYFDKLVIQGRLPERFKYAAIALILDNPIQLDWKKSSYPVDWESVAPLVHDGGDEYPDEISPLWKNKGKTEFVRRGNVVYSEKEQEGDRDGDKEDVVPVVEDQTIEDRVTRENIFYQRSAFALYCLSGFAPREVPEDIKKEAGSAWLSFEDGLKDLLKKYSLSSVGKAEWFVERPEGQRNWSNCPEEDLEYVHTELIELEEFKNSSVYALLRQEVGQLMEQLSQKIDSFLGIDILKRK